MKSQKSAEKKNFVWTGMEHDIVFPEFESLDIHYVRLHSTSISPRFHLTHSTRKLVALKQFSRINGLKG